MGLITNHTALTDSMHLIDLLASEPDVNLTALFGPEHGILGEVDDAERIPDTFNERIGVPVHSLYGTSPGVVELQLPAPRADAGQLRVEIRPATAFSTISAVTMPVGTAMML